MSEEIKPRKPRGFAAMDPARVREIARQGGKAAHVQGTAHEFTSDEARTAGRAGGQATHVIRRARKEAAEAPVNASATTSTSAPTSTGVSTGAPTAPMDAKKPTGAA